MQTISAIKAAELFDTLPEDAPADVRKATADILVIAQAGGRVPTDLMGYVRSYIGKQQEQDRYGK